MVLYAIERVLEKKESLGRFLVNKYKIKFVIKNISVDAHGVDKIDMAVPQYDFIYKSKWQVRFSLWAIFY